MSASLKALVSFQSVVTISPPSTIIVVSGQFRKDHIMCLETYLFIKQAEPHEASIDLFGLLSRSIILYDV